MAFDSAESYNRDTTFPENLLKSRYLKTGLSTFFLNQFSKVFG